MSEPPIEADLYVECYPYNKMYQGNPDIVAIQDVEIEFYLNGKKQIIHISLDGKKVDYSLNDGEIKSRRFATTHYEMARM